jgi:prevent-host-death family protein
MKIASVADVKAQLSRYIQASRSGPVVVTKNGRPVAVLLSVDDEEEIERLQLAYSPKFQKIVSMANEQLRAGQGLDHDEFWKEVSEETKNRSSGQQLRARAQTQYVTRRRGASTQAYPAHHLANMNTVFRNASHKLRDLSPTGKNSNKTEQLLLIDLIVACAREVVHLTDAGVLSPDEIPNLDYIQHLASLEGERLQAQRGKERASRPTVPRGLGQRFAQVFHRIRIIDSKSKDKHLYGLMDQSLEHLVSVAFDRLRAAVPLMRT